MDFPDITPDECLAMDSHLLSEEEAKYPTTFGPPTLAEFKRSLDVLSTITAWGDSTLMPQSYSESQWATVLAERARLGRPLEAAELQSIVDADRGLDSDH